MSFPAFLRLGAVTPAVAAWRATVLARVHMSHARAPRGRQHILQLAWLFPPHDSTGTHLPASFARHAREAGWDVTVVCSPSPAAPTAAGQELLAGIAPGTRIRPVPRLIVHGQHVRLHPADWSLPKIDGDYVTALAMTATALSSVADDPPSVVFASGPEFCNFLAARWLARAFGAKLVLHYRDEWTVNTPSYVNAGADDRAEELRCLRSADLIGFVSDGKTDAYRKAFPDVAPDRMITVPNGWDSYFHGRARTHSQHLSPGKGKFTITYTGRWHTSLQGFIATIERLVARDPGLAARLRIIFVGNQLPANLSLIEAFRGRHGGLLLALPATTLTQAIEIQRESDALLLINEHAYGGVVPLKTFDYMCSSRPILVYGRRGGAAGLVARLDAGIVVDADDAEGFGRAISRFMQAPAAWDGDKRRAWVREADRSRLDRRLLDAIAALEHNPGAAAPAVKWGTGVSPIPAAVGTAAPQPP